MVDFVDDTDCMAPCLEVEVVEAVVKEEVGIDFERGIAEGTFVEDVEEEATAVFERGEVRCHIGLVRVRLL